jgi:CRP/FNR family transcriptional regulator, cyclic AMP receptor protein
MDFSSFFDYPETEADTTRDEFVFLPTWRDQEWAKLLEYTETRLFNAGDLVLRAGDNERALYLVAFGRFEVLLSRGEPERLIRFAMIEAGSVLGEQSFLDGYPRSATIRAVDEGQMFHLSLDAFEIFAAKEPKLARDLLFDLGRILSLRLRQTTAFIADWTA